MLADRFGARAAFERRVGEQAVAVGVASLEVRWWTRQTAVTEAQDRERTVRAFHGGATGPFARAFRTLQASTPDPFAVRTRCVAVALRRATPGAAACAASGNTCRTSAAYAARAAHATRTRGRAPARRGAARRSAARRSAASRVGAASGCPTTSRRRARGITAAAFAVAVGVTNGRSAASRCPHARNDERADGRDQPPRSGRTSRHRSLHVPQIATFDMPRKTSLQSPRFGATWDISSPRCHFRRRG
jgi:hypothetical protein